MEAVQHTLFVVEDDVPTSERLVAAAESDGRLTVKGVVHTLQDAMNRFTDIAQCDAVLTDLGLPDGDGVELIEALCKLEAPPRVLVISVFGDERRVVRAIEAGASGYLLKDSDEASLGDSICRTIQGECPINPSIARYLLRRFQANSSTSTNTQPVETPLTPKETEVLKVLARGYSNGEVADLLEVSVHTVTSHTKNIYRKLAVNSRSEAVFEASQMGLIDIERSRQPGS